MARLVSLGIIATLIVLLGLTFYQFVAPFLMPIFVAAMVALLSQPLFHRILNRRPGRRSLAAMLTTGTLLASVMLPLLTGIILGAIQLQELASLGIDWARSHVPKPGAMRSVPSAADDAATFQNRVFLTLDSFLGDHPGWLDREALGITSATEDQTQDELRRDELTARRRDWFEQSWLQSHDQVMATLKTMGVRTLAVLGRSGQAAITGTASLTVELMGAAASMLIALVVFGLALHYFLAEGPELIGAAQALIPIDRKYQHELMSQFESSMRAVVLATFLAAAAQGAATAVAMRFCGVGPFFLILILATVGAFVPFVGTALVWVPAALWLFATGHWGLALFLTLFCVIVVGMLDNVVRTWVLKNDTSLHPLMAFVSVLGGLQAMGLWGVFIGPIVACCLQALIRIFNEEVKQMPDVTQAVSAAGAASTPAALNVTVTESVSGSKPSSPQPECEPDRANPQPAVPGSKRRHNRR